MELFISWSGSRSRSLASILHEWIPEVIQQVKPWISSEDISKGSRWILEVSKRLESNAQGIVCVTPENQSSAWLNFEAGALAKSLSESSVRPILFGVAPTEVVGPLSTFQATKVDDPADMMRLLESLNQSCGEPLPESMLKKAFNRSWDDFASEVEQIESKPEKGSSRTTEDVLAEVLAIVRRLERNEPTPDAVALIASRLFENLQSDGQRALSNQMRDVTHGLELPILLDKSPKRVQRAMSETEIARLQPGVAVKHSVFGSGVVVATEGEGDKKVVTVSFPDGEKRLLPRVTLMTVVDS